MAYPWTSEYLLTMFRRLVNRAGIADAVTTASYYERLSEAQAAIVLDIASVFPSCLYPAVAYGSIPTLTTTDQKNYTFGTDANGFAIAPMGKVTIYRSLNDIPSNPMVPSVDYIPLGGTMIQIPNNNTGPATLYWRGITPPSYIDGSGSHEPVLFPEGTRNLIAYRAAIAFLTEAGRDRDTAAEYKLLYGRPLHPTLPGLFAQALLMWETQYVGGGALSGPTVSGLAVALGSSINSGGF